MWNEWPNEQLPASSKEEQKQQKSAEFIAPKFQALRKQVSDWNKKLWAEEVYFFRKEMLQLARDELTKEKLSLWLKKASLTNVIEDDNKFEQLLLQAYRKNGDVWQLDKWIESLDQYAKSEWWVLWSIIKWVSGIVWAVDNLSDRAWNIADEYIPDRTEKLAQLVSPVSDESINKTTLLEHQFYSEYSRMITSLVDFTPDFSEANVIFTWELSENVDGGMLEVNKSPNEIATEINIKNEL